MILSMIVLFDYELMNLLYPIGSLDNYDLNTVNVLNEWAHVEHGINDHFAWVL